MLAAASRHAADRSANERVSRHVPTIARPGHPADQPFGGLRAELRIEECRLAIADYGWARLVGCVRSDFPS